MIQLLTGYWLFLTVVEIAKTIRLHLLEEKLPNTTHTSKYPSSDQLLDNVVLLALYALFLLLELVALVRSRGQKPVPFELRGLRERSNDSVA
ncbi:hypothetical protein V5O48_012186 [Marasmius crinis-equi]|uniref:Uncharacterized protein n=1 Tax=Marasmius crinis-equi TaxID=585013 RepID=A0ABR3F3H7_9AGAR